MEYTVKCVPKTDVSLNQAVYRLLNQEGIQKDENLEYTCAILDENGNPIATGSCFGNTLRCIAVDHHYQGKGFLNLLILHLTEYQLTRGNTHLFLYTKTDKSFFFQDLGFDEVANVAGKISFLENRKKGFQNYINLLKEESNPLDTERKNRIGAIVINANPFTKGHLYLAEKAAKMCDLLHIFVVSEDCSIVPFPVRWELVKMGTSHLKNVIYHKSGPYMISQQTFPSYFLKEPKAVCEAHARLDIAIFERIAQRLQITDRFVGEEPNSTVTALYNHVMVESMKGGPVKITVIPRIQVKNRTVSASIVREYIRDGKLCEVKDFVPKTTWDFFNSAQARLIIKAIQEKTEVEHD